MKHTMMCNYCGKILERTIEIKDGENIKHQCPKCGIFIVAETGRKECYKCGTELTEIGKIDDLEKIGTICQNCQERVAKQIKEHSEIVKEGGIYFRCLKCKTNGVIRPHNKLCQEVREKLGAPIPEACGIEIESCYNCEDKPCCKNCEECKE